MDSGERGSGGARGVANRSSSRAATPWGTCVRSPTDRGLTLSGFPAQPVLTDNRCWLRSCMFPGTDQAAQQD